MPVEAAALANLAHEAQLGDAEALGALAREIMPVVYNVVARAADRDLDVDDVVQETMIRFVRGIGGLRDVERVRPWVVSIAMRQLTDARGAARERRLRSGQLDTDRPDASADVEKTVAVLDGLAREQVELVDAADWLDTGHRDLLALWWLELRGELTRAEVAEARGEPARHTAVHLQRMREQLESSRAVVRAMGRTPRCGGLRGVVRSWDGRPAPLWRKRVARHVRRCETCGAQVRAAEPTQRLLAAAPLAAVPALLGSPGAARLAAMTWGDPAASWPGATAASGTASGTASSTGASTASSTGASTAAGFGGRSTGVVASALGTVGGKAVSLALSAAVVALVLVVGVGAQRSQSAAAEPTPTTTRAGSTTHSAAPRATPAPPDVTTAPTAEAPAPADATAQSPAAVLPVTPAQVPAVVPAPFGLTSATFRTDLPAFPSSDRVDDLGAVLQGARIGGRDNGQSALYEGRSVWIFDDTTLKNPWGFLSNSGAMTDDLTASDGIDLRSGSPSAIQNDVTPAELVPRTSAERAYEAAHPGVHFAFWPGPVVADPVRGRVLFTYGKLCRGGADGTECTGPMGKGLGMGVAAIDMHSGAVTRLQVRGRPPVTSIEGVDPTIFLPPGSTVGSAAALVIDADLYLYGDCQWGCRLAKVPLDRVEDLGAWQFFDKGTWGGRPDESEGLVSLGGAGQTVFYSAGLKAYVNVFMPYGSTSVRYQVGGSPFGPWSRERELFRTTPAGTDPGYALFAHPEYAEKNGLVQYLTYFDPGSGEQRLLRWEMTP